jgi:hypothetical protein
MKNYIIVLLVVISIYSCNTSQKTVNNNELTKSNITNDTIRIENEELEYEIIIIEIGFESWLATQNPMSYYSNNTLAIRNHFDVVTWNQRVLEPSIYNPQLYEQIIEYDPLIDYGIEVNYKLFMYFKFFQKKYRQKL